MLDSPQWPTGRMLSAVARRIERDWNVHLARWGLNHASLPVLFHLAGGPRSQQQLATASGVTQQTMSRIVHRLERLGHVERRPHARDARAYEVVLTEQGRATLAEAGDPRFAEDLSVRGLTPDQVRTLREILATMIRAGEVTDDDRHP